MNSATLNALTAEAGGQTQSAWHKWCFIKTLDLEQFKNEVQSFGIKVIDIRENTLLHALVAKPREDTQAHLAALRWLIEQGADVNARNMRGETSLHAADSCNDAAWKAAMLEFLLEQGADINAQDERGETILMRACLRASAHDCELILKLGARGEVKDQIACMATHYIPEASAAYFEGESPVETVMRLYQLLAQAGAPVDCRGKNILFHIISPYVENLPSSGCSPADLHFLLSHGAETSGYVSDSYPYTREELTKWNARERIQECYQAGKEYTVHLHRADGGSPTKPAPTCTTTAEELLKILDTHEAARKP